MSNNSVARATVLIPLIGYWIIFNEHLIGYTELTNLLFRHYSPNAPATDVLHVPYRLFVIYFGLCFIAVGSALYQWRCPEEIKLFASASEYVGGNIDKISRVEVGRIQAELENSDDAGKAAATEFDEREDQIHLRAAPGEIDKAIERITRNLLQKHFDWCNRRFACTRRIIYWLYIFGFGCLTASSLEIFARVVGVLVRAII